MDQRVTEPAAPDWRRLCSRMAAELDYYRQLLADDRREAHPLAVEARAALAAEPVAALAGPTDDELALIYHDCCRGCEFMDQGGFEDGARAVLARFGHQPTPPAAPAGEVGELVALLRYEAREADLDLMTTEQCHRAADLLEQRHPAPMPVPVSERWPEFSDCDAQERLWCSMGGEMWELRQIHSLDTHWLPANALPLPSGEVE